MLVLQKIGYTKPKVVVVVVPVVYNRNDQMPQ